jgi:hypothetical protein
MAALAFLSDQKLALRSHNFLDWPQIGKERLIGWAWERLSRERAEKDPLPCFFSATADRAPTSAWESRLHLYVHPQAKIQLIDLLQLVKRLIFRDVT